MRFKVVGVNKLVKVVRGGGVIFVYVLDFVIGLFVDEEGLKVNKPIARRNRRDDDKRS